MKLDVQPLDQLQDQPFGAMVRGWNPGAGLSASDEGTVRDALRDHQVLVFRGHTPPSDTEIIDFANQFGDLVKGSEWFGDIDPRPEILRVNNLSDKDGISQGIAASEALEWHSDYSYVATVGKESFLEAVEIPTTNPPQTCFCSQYNAFDRLSPAMVKMLRPLRAYHSITAYTAGDEGLGETPSSPANNPNAGEDVRQDFKAKQDRNKRLGITRPAIPEAEHPVILRHPDTGREILYVSKGITRHIIGMPADESKDLLKELAAHSTAPENVYCHDWQTGDLVMFDTLGTLHRRDAWDPSQRRSMRQLSTLWSPPN